MGSSPFVLRSLGVVFGAGLVGGAWLVAAGCRTVDLVPPPDASSANCHRSAVVFCEAGAPGPMSCTADPNAENLLVRLLPATPFPARCEANVLSGRVDLAGSCVISGSCTCFENEAGTAAAWDCFGDTNPPPTGDATPAGSDR